MWVGNVGRRVARLRREGADLDASDRTTGTSRTSVIARKRWDPSVDYSAGTPCVHPKNLLMWRELDSNFGPQ